MHLTPELVNYLMSEALLEANTAAKNGEVPVGAVIAHQNKIIGRGRNTTEADQTVIAHAEIHAINVAAKSLGNWRLTECVLCVTLEPCTMCLGAIRLARIPTLIFGAGDSKQGAVGSLYDLSQDKRLGEIPRVIRSIEAERCRGVLEGFFRAARREGK
jgi:tRNA(adenine34) deaminase